MRSILKQCLIGIILPSLIIAGFNSYIFASNINPAIANINYWYADDDIRGVITNRLGSRAYIAPAVPNSPELIRDVANSAVNEARSGKAALIPVNLNGSHWTAIAIRAKTNGDLVVFYNDSFGSSVGGTNSESGQYIEAIRLIVPTAQIIDLQVHQQNDGSSCGAFTAENLIALAILDQNTLTPEAARALLAKINDARAIRALQLSSLASLKTEVTLQEELATSQIVIDNIEAITEVSFNEITNFNGITMDRLGDLYLADSFDTGLSAGDEMLTYGAWARGSIIHGVFKSKDSSKLKHSSTGTTIGFDSKIDDDTTAGFAVSYNWNSLKPKATNQANSANSNLKSIIGSLYGSINADERLVFRGNIEFGKIYGKTNYQSIFSNNNSLKLKGDLFGANIGANYYVPVSSFVLVPSFDVSYETLKLSANQQDSLKIGKTNIRKITMTPGIGLTRVFDLGQMRIIPELTASYGFAAMNKVGKLIITNNNGAVITSSKPTTSKSITNIGGNITFAGSTLELTLGYERIIQNRYNGQLGYAKLRINF